MVDPTLLCNRFQAMVAWVISEVEEDRTEVHTRLGCLIKVCIREGELDREN